MSYSCNSFHQNLIQSNRLKRELLRWHLEKRLSKQFFGFKFQKNHLLHYTAVSFEGRGFDLNPSVASDFVRFIVMDKVKNIRTSNKPIGDGQVTMITFMLFNRREHKNKIRGSHVWRPKKCSGNLGIHFVSDHNLNISRKL